MHKVPLNFVHCLFFLFTVLLSGCSSQMYQGEKNSETARYNELEYLMEQDLTFNEIELKVNQLVASNILKDDVFRNNIPETTRLIVLAKQKGITQAVDQLASSQPERGVVFAELALNLFSQQRMQIIENLRLDSSLQEDEIISAALRTSLSPDEVAQPTASGVEYEIVPLIQSASITLFNQDSSKEASVQYREEGSSEWSEGLPLFWEPVRSALSGSIVKLKPATDYEVHITLMLDDAVSEERYYQFKTRANSPPVNPDLVYQLSDIYKGGQLDLTVLNIHGEKGGWAKIIGDPNTAVIPDETDEYAINIGNNSYIVFENIVVKGGRRHAVYSRGAHHLWFKGCDISEWGRIASYFKNGKGYESSSDQKPINYDAGMLLYKSGVVVIEDCEIHSPNYGANHWGYGHPNGATAMLIMANHPEYAYQGQYIIRNNRFYGTEDVRFNDVIESRSNGRVFGGFMSNSAIYGNYLAYANDDVIELDGGQSNVLFYNNEVEQGYCGVSAVPNMLGPSYIFNNYIHNLGDERGASWAAIKLGGLFSYPSGLVNIFNNYINVRNNGITGVSFGGDSTFWANVRNNVIISSAYNSSGYGFAVIDREKYHASKYVNNLFFNKTTESAVYDASVDVEFEHEDLVDLDFVENFQDSSRVLLELEGNSISNFSSFLEDELIIGL